MQRERLQYDVLIVGGGPSGLSAACRLKQLAQQHQREISVCLVEKASEIGAHIISGALLQPTALEELFPDWRSMNAPLNVPVIEDEVHYLFSAHHHIRLPEIFAKRVIHNHGNYVISLGSFCRWLARQAESLGVEIYPGFAAAHLLWGPNGEIIGVQTGDMGVDRHGEPRANFQPGVEIEAKFTLFAEGCRGHLGKTLIKHFELDRDAGVQHYAIGIKELWEIDPALHEPGKVLHCFGWPLSAQNTGGGAFLYHFENNLVSLGLITDLNYENPYLSPFDELQRVKLHPQIRRYLEGGKRIGYGARAINKGGLQAIPKLSFPGGLLSGCDAGFMNYPKIKGTHTAMKTGMLAAESLFDALTNNVAPGATLSDYETRIRHSWVYQELHSARNVAPAMHRFGMLLGSIFSFFEYGLMRGRSPITLQDAKPDHACLKPASECNPIDYPKPDGKLTFDKLSSVYLSNTTHDEEQPCHLRLIDADLPLRVNLPTYQEPAQRYCPAGVYEVVEENAQPVFRINAQNCIHCKTCDIKDPAQNIVWTPPEGGSGPLYSSL